MFRRILKEQRGAFMVFFAILVPLFIGMIGFAVDAGFIYMQKAKMQDIADAAALAGAARLNDGADKEGHVTSAVRAYAEANGLSGVATAMASLDESSDLPTKYDKLKILQGIQYNVTDKDGKQRDHVKVVIAKRVPTFFINVLFPDQKDGVVVKVAAAAEYVEGEEVPVSGDGQKIMTGHLNTLNNYSGSLVMDENYDFSIYAGASGVQFEKLPAKGTVYANSYSGIIPDGREFIRNNKSDYEYGSSEKEQEEKRKKEAANKLFEEKKNSYYSNLQNYINDIQSYKNGVGSKRYIGGIKGYSAGPEENYKWKNELITNIKPTDTEIELYIEPNNLYVLSDACLKNVKYIKKMIVGQCDRYVCIINTKSKRFGDIYSSVTLDVEGENNYFDGLIYSASELYVWGKDNYMWSNQMNSDARMFSNDTMYIGGGYSVTSEFTHVDNNNIVAGNVAYSGPHRNGVGSDWHIYFGGSSGSGSSGSDDSGDETKAHVRLVE